MQGLIIPAFISGLLMFLAPCTLPLVPGFLGFVAGVNEKELGTSIGKKQLLKNSLFFVVGFSVVFILVGLLLGLAGSLIAPYKVLVSRIGGVLVVFFGLYMLGLIPVQIYSNSSFRIPRFLQVGTLGSSFVIGASFALGWSPCIGPILGTILILAGTLGTALQGAFLLLVFSFGLAIPFMVTAFLYGRATVYIQKVSKFAKWVSIIGGLFLVCIGMLLLLDRFGLLLEWGFELLKFINYESLEQYL